MGFFAQFRNVEEQDKAAAVKKLIEDSTPDYDFFVMVGLSVLMSTLGVLLDSASIVIGSMLIAPILYPILSLSLGAVISDYKVMGRSATTILKATSLGVLLAAATTILQNPDDLSGEVLSRIEPSIAYFVVAVVSGIAATFALVRPQLSASFPGVAISVALIPPLSVIGIGLAELNGEVIIGAAALFVLNIVGILFAAMFSLSLLNIYQKRNVAETTLKREEARMEEEHEAAKKIANGKDPE